MAVLSVPLWFERPHTTSGKPCGTGSPHIAAPLIPHLRHMMPAMVVSVLLLHLSSLGPFSSCPLGFSSIAAPLIPHLRHMMPAMVVSVLLLHLSSLGPFSSCPLGLSSSSSCRPCCFVPTSSFCSFSLLHGSSVPCVLLLFILLYCLHCVFSFLVSRFLFFFCLQWSFEVTRGDDT